jgi:hypothetical protein
MTVHTPAYKAILQYRLGRKRYLQGRKLHEGGGYYFKMGYRDAEKEHVKEATGFGMI